MTPPPATDPSDDDHFHFSQQDRPDDDNISNIVQLDGQDVSVLSSGSTDSVHVQPQPIPVINSNRCFANRPITKVSARNVKTVKRSNKQLEALLLPTVINLNPRSVYNKLDEFHTLVTDLDADLVTMSESWERENLTLEKVIHLENYKIISNVHQRRGKGGRPGHHCQ